MTICTLLNSHEIECSRVENICALFNLISCWCQNFIVCSQRHNIAFGALLECFLLHRLQEIKEIFSNVVIFFEQKHKTGVKSCDFQLIEDSIRFPPPVMFGLRVRSFPVVAVEVGKIRVFTFGLDCLLFRYISGTIFWISSRKLVRICLNRERIKNLYDFAKVDALHQLVDFFVVKVVREDQQRFRNITRLWHTWDQLSQVYYSFVNLHHDDDRVVLQRLKLFFIFYLFIRQVYKFQMGNKFVHVFSFRNFTRRN